MCQDVVLHCLFAKAKAKQIQIAGFPDFAAAMRDLAKVHGSEQRADYSYQVTLPAGENLIVLQALLDKYSNSSFSGDFQKLLDSHDKEFNKEHKRAGAEEAVVKATNRGISTSPKKLKKEFETVEEFQEAHAG